MCHCRKCVPSFHIKCKDVLAALNICAAVLCVIFFGVSVLLFAEGYLCLMTLCCSLHFHGEVPISIIKVEVGLSSETFFICPVQIL
jgi:hypothetical protein